MSMTPKYRQKVSISTLPAWKCPLSYWTAGFLDLSVVRNGGTADSKYG